MADTLYLSELEKLLTEVQDISQSHGYLFSDNGVVPKCLSILSSFISFLKTNESSTINYDSLKFLHRNAHIFWDYIYAKHCASCPHNTPLCPNCPIYEGYFECIFKLKNLLYNITSKRS
ncbi:MAG TPA: hypothetical protein VIK84_06620 [Haloplasmataceae bacterium]